MSLLNATIHSEEAGSIRITNTEEFVDLMQDSDIIRLTKLETQQLIRILELCLKK